MWDNEKIWKVDDQDAAGDWPWEEPEEEKPNKGEQVKITDQDCSSRRSQGE